MISTRYSKIGQSDPRSDDDFSVGAHPCGRLYMLLLPTGVGSYKIIFILSNKTGIVSFRLRCLKLIYEVCMKAFIRVMKALSDPNRVRVLKLLQTGELCVCEIQNVLGLAQSTVSKHMKLLEDAGLVARKRQGTWIIYSLAKESDSPYAAAMLSRLQLWLDDDEELARMQRTLPEAAVLRDCSLKN